MQKITLRSVFSVAEIVIGLISVGIGSFSLLLNLKCPPDAFDCVGWGVLGAAMFLIPGILVMGAGVLSYVRRQIPLLIIQAVLIGILVPYFVWGFE